MQVQDEFQELFNHMHQEFGVSLLHTEMTELIDLCIKVNNSLSEFKRQPVSNNEQTENKCECGGNYRVAQDCTMKNCKHTSFN